MLLDELTLLGVAISVIPTAPHTKGVRNQGAPMCKSTQPAKIALAAMGISNREIGGRIGKTAGYVGRVLNGHAKPSAQFRADLAALLDLPVEQLFDDSPCSCRTKPSREQLGSLLRAAQAS